MPETIDGSWRFFKSALLQPSAMKGKMLAATRIRSGKLLS
jgi:hypothetical protein